MNQKRPGCDDAYHDAYHQDEHVYGDAHQDGAHKTRLLRGGERPHCEHVRSCQPVGLGLRFEKAERHWLLPVRD
jgi:hypothetical protein